MGAREKFFQGGRAKIAQKILFHKSMLMIWSTINILPLFTYFIIYLRNKKCQFDFENSHISVQNN